MTIIYIIIPIILLCVILKTIKKKPSKKKTILESYKTTAHNNPPKIKYYCKKEKLLSAAELSFYKVLNLLIQNQNFIIFPKVRMEDIVNINNKLDWKTKSSKRNSIKSRHIDFILCNPTYSSILCAIELDDKSHNKKKNQENDKIKETILTEANIIFYRIPAKSKYSLEEIKHILFE